MSRETDPASPFWNEAPIYMDKDTYSKKHSRLSAVKCGPVGRKTICTFCSHARTKSSTETRAQHQQERNELWNWMSLRCFLVLTFAIIKRYKGI